MWIPFSSYDEILDLIGGEYLPYILYGNVILVCEGIIL